jgi:hypothetical protein
VAKSVRKRTKFLTKPPPESYSERAAGIEKPFSQIRLNAGMSHNVVTYDVVVDIDNTEGKLLPYMTAKPQFVVAERSKVLLVPNLALRWRPTKERITASARDK